MAKIFYLLKQNKVKNSKINGKWFAHGKTVEVLNTRKMAQHIAESLNFTSLSGERVDPFASLK